MGAATRIRFRPALLWAALLVLAWALFTSLFGGSSAHADEDRPGPLDSVSSLLGGTLGHVASTANDLLDEADTAVAPAVDIVASIPVVGTVTAPVLHETSQLATDVAQQLSETATSAPVSEIVAPVNTIVSHVPVVGAVADELGVPVLGEEVAKTVDSTLAATGDALEAVVPAVVAPIDPGPSATPNGPREPAAPGSIPADPAGEEPDETTAPAATAAPVAPDSSSAWTATSDLLRATPWRADALQHPTADATQQPPVERQPVPAPAAPAPSLSTSTGASPHGSRSGPDCAAIDPHSLIQPGRVAAFRVHGDALPPAPTLETDCSPD